MATPPVPAVTLARKRRPELRAGQEIRIDWFADDVLAEIQANMEVRVGVATELLKSQTIKNISKPVTKTIGPLGGRVVTDRSEPGEFPRADTGLLMKSILSDVRQVGGDWQGVIGTTLDYGVILEVRMGRSFLRRTLNEEAPRLRRILAGPIK